MCGIVGLFHRDAAMPIDRPLLAQMNEFVHHRGPDDAGLFVAPGIGFGHRRLSIIDLSAGHQPMRDDARKRTITYNGEIYNYREVRDRLIRRGIVFKTNCDTEVLLKAAEFESVDWLEQLNGMFAFAIWDAESRTLLLGRDRLGVKPLYYTVIDGEFVFASEIKPILLHPNVRREIDRDRIPEYLAFRTISGNGTLFSGIQQVPPGHVLTISRRDFQPRLTQFWSEGEGRQIADYVDPELPVDRQLEALLIQAVRYRLVSDVPVGSFNSGGVDSSLNSAIMRSLIGGEMHTFSVGFEEAEYDETPFANMVARQLKTNHHRLVVTERDYVDHLQETLLHLEEPISHAHTVQLLLLSRVTKQYVTVALTGEGADEVFGGYPRLQIPVLAQYLRFVPRILSRAVREHLLSGRSRKLVKLLETAGDVKRSIIENARHVPVDDLARLLPERLTYPDRERVYERSVARERSVVGQALYFDQRTYLPNLLVRLDKSSMASGLECRVPFLDVNVVEWSRHVADRYKIRPGTMCKFLVKKVAERWLPREIVYRDKVGFGTPVGRWLRNKKGLGSFLDLLTDQTFRQRGYFDGREVERLVREHVEKGLNHEEALWGLLNLELWCRTFIDSQDAVTHFHARRVPQDSRPTILSSSPSPVVEAPTTQA
jgi:asparagine synthase (glutamine-hydrolysing)